MKREIENPWKLFLLFQSFLFMRIKREMCELCYFICQFRDENPEKEMVFAATKNQIWMRF